MNSSTIYFIKTTIFILALFPFVLELFAFICILRYRKYATNISKNTNDFFRAIKLRYTNSAKLNIPVRSSKSFIKKVLLGSEGLMTYIFTIDRLSLFITFINLFASVAFAIKGHTNFTYIIAIMSISFYLFRQGCALEAHSDFIISMTEDYLDNTLYHIVKPIRENGAHTAMANKENIVNEIDNSHSEAGDNKSTLHDNKTQLKKAAAMQLAASSNTDDSTAVPAATNHIIESILHEFLS